MPRAGRSARSAAGSTGWRACRAPRRSPAPSPPPSATRAARTRGSACPARTTRACHLLQDPVIATVPDVRGFPGSCTCAHGRRTLTDRGPFSLPELPHRLRARGRFRGRLPRGQRPDRAARGHHRRDSPDPAGRHQARCGGAGADRAVPAPVGARGGGRSGRRNGQARDRGGGGRFGLYRPGQRPAVLGADRGGRRGPRVQPDQPGPVAHQGDADLPRPGHLHAGGGAPGGRRGTGRGRARDRRSRAGRAARPGADGPRFHRHGRGAHGGPVRQRPALRHRGGRGGGRRQAGRHGAHATRAPAAEAAIPGYVRRGGRRRTGRVRGQRGTGLGGGERRERGPATRIAARRADIDHGGAPKYSSVTHSTHGDRMARLRQAGSAHRRRRLARPVSEELSDQVSHRPFRSTLVSVASGLAAAIAISWVCGPAPARAAAGYSAAGRGVQAQEWWLDGLHVRQTWPSTQGAGITVAVLGTGVDPRHPDLTGSVTTGPDFTGSGRTQAGPFWGINGTAVAGAIAGHGHGTGRTDGLLGVAPMAKILSVRVSLEFNDPLNSDRAIARRLPGAIASGIIYAVDHGARIIDLPLDPGTAGLTGQGSPAAAGGSPAEQAAVAYALRKNVVLVAPAGDDGLGPDLTDHPAAYAGVIAAGAIARNGRLAPFSNRHSYVSLTAPGVGLTAAVPPDGYARISSTSTSSGIVAGVAALIRSRFPHLSAAQVGRALTGGTTTGSATGGTSAPGTGRGTIDAAKAVGLAASLNAAAEPRQPTATARPSQSGQRLSTTAAHRANASDLAGSLVRYVVGGLCVLIVLLVALLLVMRSRRERALVAAAEVAPGRTRTRGQHEQRTPQPVSGPVTGHRDASRSQLAPPPGRSGAGGWAATGGWQGSSLGEMQPPPAEPFRPVIAPAPKPGRPAAKAAPSPAGPPWAPAPEPVRMFGPLPSVPNSALAPGPGIRVPGDVPAMPAGPPGTMLPAPFDVNASPDPDFPPRPAPDAEPGLGRPTRQSLGFAAAPVPVDYAPPQAPDFTVPSRAAGLLLSGDTAPSAPSAGSGPSAASGSPGLSGLAGSAPVSGGPAEDPSYIWDLAATDVFPAAAEPGSQTA